MYNWKPKLMKTSEFGDIKDYAIIINSHLYFI